MHTFQRKRGHQHASLLVPSKYCFVGFSLSEVFVCLYAFANHFAALRVLLTADYGLKTLKATSPGGSQKSLGSLCGGAGRHGVPSFFQLKPLGHSRNADFLRPEPQTHLVVVDKLSQPSLNG